MQNCIDLAREPRFDKFDHFCSGLWEATFPRTVCRVMLLEVISAALGNLVYALEKCFFFFPPSAHLMDSSARLDGKSAGTLDY
jgi:hypothetical protein